MSRNLCPPDAARRAINLSGLYDNSIQVGFSTADVRMQALANHLHHPLKVAYDELFPGEPKSDYEANTGNTTNFSGTPGWPGA